MRYTCGRSRSACPARSFGFFVADWGSEVNFEVGLHRYDGALVCVWFYFEDGDVVGLVVVGECEYVAFTQAREVAESVFEDGARV